MYLESTQQTGQLISSLSDQNMMLVRQISDETKNYIYHVHDVYWYNKVTPWWYSGFIWLSCTWSANADTDPVVAKCWTSVADVGPTFCHRWAGAPSIKRRWVVQRSTHGEGMPNPVDGRVWRNNLVSGFALLANSNADAGVLLVDWIPASSPIPCGQYPVQIRANTTTLSMRILNYSPHSRASEVSPA